MSASLYFLWWVECLPTWRQANQLKDFQREKAPRISFSTCGEKGNEKLWYGVNQHGVKIRAEVKIRVVGSPRSWDFFTMCLEPQSGVGRNDDDDQNHDDQPFKHDDDDDDDDDDQHDDDQNHDDQPFKHDDDQQTSAVGLNEEMAR